MYTLKKDQQHPSIATDAMKTLIQTMTMTGIDYCHSLYIGLPGKNVDNLQLAQNSAARIIQRTHSREHITPILEQLNWLPITKRSQMKLLTYKTLHGDDPSYFSTLLNRYNTVRTPRASYTKSQLTVVND